MRYNPAQQEKFRCLFAEQISSLCVWVAPAAARADYCLLKSGTQGASVSATILSSRSWG